MNKRVNFLLFLFALLSLIVSFQDTYGKYLSSATAESNIQIARWNIAVNNQMITENNQTVNTITPYFINNQNIADGYIAPSAVGYFDLEINAAAVDVSFEYKITANVSVDSSVQDLIVSGYSVDGGAIVDTSTIFEQIEEMVNLSNPDKTRTIRIFIKWQDTSGTTMDNLSDTAAALSAGKAKIDIQINFKQVITG